MWNQTIFFPLNIELSQIPFFIYAPDSSLKQSKKFLLNDFVASGTIRPSHPA